MSLRPAQPLASLADAVAGEVLLPGSPAYEAARRPAIANFAEVRPRAVVRCAAPADVAAAIAVATRAGLPAAIRSGGHCFAGRSSTEGVVIDVGPLRSVAVAGGTVRVGAGARLGEVYDALAPRDVTVAAGCGPEVGIAGLALGGGLGVLGRRHGLTSDQLLAAQVVLADGRVVECDREREPDLFWALRGAGGARAGVLTALTLRTVRAPATTTFHLVWPYADAAAVLGAWQRWAPDGPDQLAASLLLTAPRDPAAPPAVNVFGAMAGSEREAAEQLDALVGLAGVEPASAATTHGPYREAKRHLAEHGPGDERPGLLFSRSEFFREGLPADAIAALVEGLAADRVPGASRELDLSPWGGAYNRVPVEATAFAHRDARFLLKQAVVVDPAAGAGSRDGARAWLDRSWSAAHPWGTGGVYPNFPEPGLDDWSPAYHGPNLDRLRDVAAAYDPDGFFARPAAP